MKRSIILLGVLLTLLLAGFAPIKQAFAYDYVPSALLQHIGTDAQAFQTKGHDNRPEILQKYLERYNSPLAPYSQAFVREADKNKLDWRLVAAISGVESYFGQQIPGGSYNGWGFGIYGNNVRRFSSWEDGIGTVSAALRSDYMDKRGAQDIYQIGSMYAADPAWAGKVSHFLSDMDTFAQNYQYQNITLPLTL